MQGTAWIDLFRRIPPEQHSSLVLMTSAGMQIVLQRLIRVEHDFLVGIGRLAGSTDQGSVMIIPYDQMNYLGFNKKLADSEIDKLFGQSTIVSSVLTVTPPASPSVVPAASSPKPAEVECSVVFPVNTANTETPRSSEIAEKIASKTAQQHSPPSKSVLLARLRQRLVDDISKQTDPR